MLSSHRARGKEKNTHASGEYRKAGENTVLRYLLFQYFRANPLPMVILMSVVSGLITIYLSFGWRAATVKKKFLIAFLWGVTILLGISAHYEIQAGKQDEERRSTVGQLNPPVLNFVPVLKFGDRTDSRFYGNSLGEFDLSQLVRGVTMKLVVRGGKLITSAIVRDMTSKPIAVIEENVWKVYNEKEFEYNNDGLGLEMVTHGERKVIFQLNLVGDTAVFRGLIMNSDGVGAYFYDTSGRSAILKVIVPTKAKIPPVKRIFKYPRELFHKQRS